MTFACSVIVTSCNMADDSDYNAMADDMCGCVNDSSKEISNEMKTAIIKAVDENKDIQVAISEVMVSNPEQGMKDVNAIVALGKNMEVCSKDLEKKYNSVYSTDSEEKVVKKLLEIIKTKKGGEFAYALMKLGEKEMKKK